MFVCSRSHEFHERFTQLRWPWEAKQQWDKENAWPPMVHMVIEGFRTTGEPDLMKVAEKMATSWLAVTYQAFIRTHAMFEKYNVTTLTEEMSAGGGGEYEVQV
ncbi:hypothetical protein COOONC_05272 [Cooperia oncophora]